MATLEDALASTLRDLRKSKGMTLRQVADVLGNAQVTVARYESTSKSKRTPRPSDLENLARVYDTTPAAIVKGAEDVRQRARKLERQINDKKKGA